MIQFKGAYFNKATRESKSVLVQFDGILLHIWQMTDPFCRLLTSDVFTLQPAIGKGKRCIKLPNGGKIETADITAFSLLSEFRRSSCTKPRWVTVQWRLICLAAAVAALTAVFVLLYRFDFYG